MGGVSPKYVSARTTYYVLTDTHWLFKMEAPAIVTPCDRLELQ